MLPSSSKSLPIDSVGIDGVLGDVIGDAIVDSVSDMAVKTFSSPVPSRLLAMFPIALNSSCSSGESCSNA